MTNLTVLSDNETSVSVNGAHVSEMTNEDVRLLLIQDQNMLHLPRNLHELFPNVEGLIIDNSSLTAISKVDLLNFPKLKLLFIGRNKIEKIESDLFEASPGIQRLGFTNNFTKKIGSGILNPLKMLKFADFDRNSCIAMKALNKNAIENLKLEIERKCQ